METEAARIAAGEGQRRGLIAVLGFPTVRPNVWTLAERQNAYQRNRTEATDEARTVYFLTNQE